MILQKKQQKSLKKNKISQAFSLIELSIVILIIGILVAGVTQSSRLVTQFRLLSARNMTQSSPVTTIKDLLIWVEATSTKSFTQEDPSDNYAIEQWNDINPVNLNRNNAIQATESRKPIYRSNIWNGLPVVRMDGSKYMTFASQVLLKPVTVFTVTNVSAFVHTAILGTSAYGLAINMGGTGKFSPVQQNYNCIIPGPCEGTNTTTLRKFAIYSYQHNQAGVYSCYFNGSLDCSGTNNINFVNQNLHIGYNELGNNLFFQGDYAEIIIYSRSLNNEERQAIEQYLARKWMIRI